MARAELILGAVPKFAAAAGSTLPALAAAVSFGDPAEVWALVLP